MTPSARHDRPVTATHDGRGQAKTSRGARVDKASVSAFSTRAYATSMAGLLAPGVCVATGSSHAPAPLNTNLLDLWAQPQYTWLGLILGGLIISLVLARLLLRNRQLTAAQLAASDEQELFAAAVSQASDGIDRALRESETRFRNTFEQAAVGIAHVGPDGRWLRINRKLCEILQYSEQELRALTFQDLTHPDDIEADLGLVRRCLDGEIDSYRIEKRYRRKDGSLVWAELTVALVRDDDGGPDYFISVVEDIDQHKHDQVALEQANSLYRGLVEHMRDGVAIYEAVDDGADFVFTAFNPAAVRSAKLATKQVIGRRVRDVFPKVEEIGLFAVFRRVYRSGTPESHKTTRYADERVALWVENYVFKLPGGQVVAVFTDVSQKKETEQALLTSQATLEQIAYHDSLTQLPNRRLLFDRLTQAIAVADRTGTALAVCYLDLDGFKPVNDQFGHAVGDALLQAVAQRFRDVTRASDTFARWGGDEFALVLTGIKDAEEGQQSVERILRAVATPYQIGEHRLEISASIGVTLYPLNKVNGDMLLRDAEHAMYLAKQRGHNCYQFFDSANKDSKNARPDARARFAKALQDGELRVLYQPIVDMRLGNIYGLEALVRWQHPERGMLLPGAFLPLIEGSALIRALDRWVMQQATNDLAGWFDQGLSTRLHVNLSAHSLLAEDFLAEVQTLLAAAQPVSSDQINLEILETAALKDLGAVTDVIRHCNEIGLSFALDDFGTGHSSLNYFRHLPARTLKIGQTFVRDMLSDQEDLRIVESVIGLAHAFGRTVIAEGVESEEHGTMLLRFGCDLGQGYGIAPPMPAPQITQWLRDYRHPRQWGSATADVWRPQDLPLLTMEAEHRRWIDELIQTAKGDGEHGPIATDDQSCRFGHWYHTDGVRQYGHMDTFKDIGALHQRVHHLGDRLLRLRENADALDEQTLEQLHMASAALIDRLTILQNAVSENQVAAPSIRAHAPPTFESPQSEDSGDPDWATPT